MLHLEHGFVWCRNLDTLESTAEIPLNVLKRGAGDGWRK
jgi:hypothetical protein